MKACPEFHIIQLPFFLKFHEPVFDFTHLGKFWHIWEYAQAPFTVAK